MRHLYGLVTLLAIFTGVATLTLGILSSSRSKEKHLKYFLVILGAFNGKFLLELFWSYIILNVPEYPKVLFMVVLVGSCGFDLVYFFFFIPLWNSLFSLGLRRWMLVAFALGLVAVFTLILLGGTYDANAMTYRPGLPAGIGNLIAILAFLWIIFVGISQFSKMRERRHRFFLGITLACSGLGFIQMAGSMMMRLIQFPQLEMRAPRPEEIGFPWLSLYFGFYMGALVYFFLKYYLLVSPVVERVKRPESRRTSAAAESGAKNPSFQAALETFCGTYDLSARERDILTLVLEGCSNEDIGKRLYITTGTVKTHMHNVFRKTGTGARTRLIRIILG